MAEQMEHDTNDAMSTSREMPNAMDKKTAEPMEGDGEMDRPMEADMGTSTEKAADEPMKRGTEKPMGTP
jgi:hypothetical protein